MTMKFLITLLAIIFLAACVGDFQCPCVRPHSNAAQRANDARLRAVEISTPCGRGSGVIISPSRVLTAEHVVQCKGIEIIDSDGKRPAKVISRTSITDMAVLEITKGPMLRAPHVRRGVAPEVGDTVCVHSTLPMERWRCHMVERRGRNLGSDMIVDMPIEPGNSGGAVYNMDGDLVGLAVGVFLCRNGQFCAAAVTSKLPHWEEL